MIFPVLPLVLSTCLFQQQQQQQQQQHPGDNINKTSRTITMMNRLPWLPSSISNSRLDKDVINASTDTGEDDDDNDVGEDTTSLRKIGKEKRLGIRR